MKKETEDDIWLRNIENKFRSLKNKVDAVAFWSIILCAFTCVCSVFVMIWSIPLFGAKLFVSGLFTAIITIIIHQSLSSMIKKGLENYQNRLKIK